MTIRSAPRSAAGEKGAAEMAGLNMCTSKTTTAAIVRAPTFIRIPRLGPSQAIIVLRYEQHCHRKCQPNWTLPCRAWQKIPPDLDRADSGSQTVVSSSKLTTTAPVIVFVIVGRRIYAQAALRVGPGETIATNVCFRSKADLNPARSLRPLFTCEQTSSRRSACICAEERRNQAACRSATHGWQDEGRTDYRIAFETATRGVG